jgi:hypothetical protein
MHMKKQHSGVNIQKRIIVLKSCIFPIFIDHEINNSGSDYGHSYLLSTCAIKVVMNCAPYNI